VLSKRGNLKILKLIGVRVVMDLREVLKRDYVQTAVMIIAAIVAVLVFWYGLSFVMGTGNPILAVASESMEPVLYRGDLILIEGIQSTADIYAASADADPQGDIIVFHKPIGIDELIVHRAISKEDNGDGTYTITTKGDNNRVPDGWKVEEEHVVGRYLGKIPWVGHIALLFAETEVKIAFILLWVVILLIVELAPVIRKRLKGSGDDGDASLYKSL
jgi:signal peptidase